MLEIRAEWDDEAQVWVATSDDVPGLVAEAPTIEVLVERLRAITPELMELNRGIVGQPFERMSDAIDALLASHRKRSAETEIDENISNPGRPTG